MTQLKVNTLLFALQGRKTIYLLWAPVIMTHTSRASMTVLRTKFNNFLQSIQFTKTTTYATPTVRATFGTLVISPPKNLEFATIVS